ncbi:MAG: OsmC family peroxiredoxin [Chloroflexota bacterium]|nr:OsmC family peroxiredoxin [Chloroflexota bacterium]
MAADRTATTTWNGNLFEGSGAVTGRSGALNELAVTWAARTEQSDGKTSPEELVAAAHSSCYSMALSNTLAQKGHEPDTIEVTATVTFVPGTGVTRSALKVVGTVPGLSEEEFKEIAREGEQNCPISNLIRQGTEITLDASLR